MTATNDNKKVQVEFDVDQANKLASNISNHMEKVYGEQFLAGITTLLKTHVDSNTFFPQMLSEACCYGIMYYEQLGENPPRALDEMFTDILNFAISTAQLGMCSQVASMGDLDINDMN